MNFQSRAFFDESGSGREGGKFFVGGYIGLVGMWKEFSDDWRDVLEGSRDKLPGWPPSHAVSIENGKAGFDVLDASQRKQRLGYLIDVIAKHRPYAVLAMVDVDRFEKRLNEVLRQKLGNTVRRDHWTRPYQFAASQLFGALYSFQEEIGNRKGPNLGRIEVIFDHMDSVGKAAKKKIEDRVRSQIKLDQPEHIYDRLGPPQWIDAGELVNYPPIQAADVLVWHYSRAFNADGEHRRAFRKLKEAAQPLFITEKNIDSQEYWIQAHTNELAKRIEERKRLAEERRSSRS